MSLEAIPVNIPYIGEEEKKLVNECLDTGWISSEGPFVKQFEKEFSSWINCSYGVAVSSGTGALDIAVKALGIKKGDEVILPSLTIMSCAQAIVTAGATPIFIDCSPDTWNIETSQIESQITSRTKAILVVHLYGLSVDMDPILHLARKYNLKIIEDAAEAHGLTYKDQPCGSFGDLSIFSFYPNKHITTGEGGMIVTSNKSLAEKCKKLRNLAFEDSPRFVHHDIGWNYRMTNVQAAIGLGQLSRKEKIVQQKRSLGNFYEKHLKKLRFFQLPLSNTIGCDNIYWVFSLVLKKNVPFQREDIVKYLQEQKIGTRPFFWPLHQQPVFLEEGIYQQPHLKALSLPCSEYLGKNGFYIPSGIGITQEQALRVIDALFAFEKTW